MSKIAVLGLGAMGSRIALALNKAGHRVTVWNRSPGPLANLADSGFAIAPTPKAAAIDADFVIAMVRDDEASRDVWLNDESGALRGMSGRAVALECSTLTPQWIRELGGHAAAPGIDLLEAPVSAIHHVGCLGTGALTKLASNALLGIQATALAEIIGRLRHNGADLQRCWRRCPAPRRGRR